MTSFINVHTDNDNVQAAGQYQVIVAPLVTVNNTYAGTDLRLSQEGKYGLVNITCTHADTIHGLTRSLHGFGLDRKKRNQDGSIYIYTTIKQSN